MGQTVSSHEMLSRPPVDGSWSESRVVISRNERGLKNGYVTVKVSSLVPNRGQTDRSSTHVVYPRGAIFHGSNGFPDAVIGALSNQNGSVCSLPERVLLQDSRVHDLLVMHTQGWHVFPSPEVFSRHSGTCLVVGDRTFQHPPVPIKLGDCFRLGSVGIVVSEYKTTDGVEERLDSKALQYLRDEAVAFDIAEEEACLAAEEGGFDVDETEDAEDVMSQGTHREVEDAVRSSKSKDNAVLKQVDECVTIDDGSETENDVEAVEDSNVGGLSGNLGTPPGSRPTISKYFCYMCYESHDTVSDPLVAPCQCRGDTRYLHVQCLQKWYQSTGNGVHAQVIRTTGNGAPACKICGAAYKTVFRNAEGKKVSLLEMNTDGPYITLIVVTKHDTNAALFNTRFRLNFSNDFAAGLDENGMNAPVSISIGRSSSCSMIVDYRTVSTRHARIFFENGQFMLQDQRSSNGTMVYLRNAMKLDFDRPVRLRMGRSTLSVEATSLTGSDNRSLFHANDQGLASAFCCNSIQVVNVAANQPRSFEGSSGVLEDNDSGSDDEFVVHAPEGRMASILTKLHLKKPPAAPEKVEKLPPLAHLSPVDVYNTLVEVSKRPQAASISDSRRACTFPGGSYPLGTPPGASGATSDSPNPNPNFNLSEDGSVALNQSPRGSRGRNSRRLERLTQVANAELDLLSEEAQVQALLMQAIENGVDSNTNVSLNQPNTVSVSDVNNASSIVVQSNNTIQDENELGIRPTVAAPNNSNIVDYDNLATSSEVNKVLNLGMGSVAGSRNITPRDNTGANNAIGAAIAAGMNLNIQAATSSMSAANLLETGMLTKKLSRKLSRDGSSRSPRRSNSDRSARTSPRIEEGAVNNSAPAPTDINALAPVAATEPNIVLSASVVSNIVDTAMLNQSALRAESSTMDHQSNSNSPEPQSALDGEEEEVSAAKSNFNSN